MKSKLTVLTTLSVLALALSPLHGAPKKTAPADSKKPAAAATKSTPAPAPAASVPAAKKKSTPKLTTTQQSKLLALLNDGSAAQLSEIRGISKTRASAIAKARPFDSVEQVILVDGIGQVTMSHILTHARTLTTTPKKSPASPRSSSSSKKKKS